MTKTVKCQSPTTVVLLPLEFIYALRRLLKCFYIELAQRKKLCPVLQSEFSLSHSYCTGLLDMFLKPFDNCSGQSNKNLPLFQSKASFSLASVNEVHTDKKFV